MTPPNVKAIVGVGRVGGRYPVRVRVLRRCAPERGGGRLIGAMVKRRIIVRDQVYVCDCCSHLVPMHSPAFLVVDRDDLERLVCSDCVDGA
jgi:hypothetical protein